MGLVAKRVADRRILRLIRGFLTAGVLADGLVGPTDEGTPQGGPLSPLLSNLMLDVLDRELERRGHHFARYADDCNIYSALRICASCARVKGYSMVIGASSHRRHGLWRLLPPRAPTLWG